MHYIKADVHNKKVDKQKEDVNIHKNKVTVQNLWKCS